MVVAVVSVAVVVVAVVVVVVVAVVIVVVVVDNKSKMYGKRFIPWKTQGDVLLARSIVGFSWENQRQSHAVRARW